MTAFADKLRDLADRADTLEAADLAGELERLRFIVWTSVAHASAAVTPTPARALDVEAVMERTGMSRGWLYRQARRAPCRSRSATGARSGSTPRGSTSGWPERPR